VAVAVASPREGFVARAVGVVKAIPGFYRDVVAEMKKVTWPDRPQVQQLSIGVIILALFIGLVIFILDWLFSLILVNGIGRLFGA
jgi:preprotein translocase subunit SecE